LNIPTLAGTIKRRLLVNFRADPEIASNLLPPPFRPKLHRGFAIVGICLIRLEHERPLGVPKLFGLASENAAHRFAVEWTEGDGQLAEGVYIPRRDTDSIANRLAGGNLFPVKSHAADFSVNDSGGHIEIKLQSRDGACVVEVVGDEASQIPSASSFDSLAEASAFFENGSKGFSPRSTGDQFDRIDLWTPDWKVGALDVSHVRSSYFEDPSRFPSGSIEFDHALVMRNLDHEWRTAEQLDTSGFAKR
jgi:hypothetical protein